MSTLVIPNQQILIIVQYNGPILVAVKGGTQTGDGVRKQSEGANQEQEQRVRGSRHATRRGRAAKNIYENTYGMEEEKDRQEKEGELTGQLVEPSIKSKHE